MLPLAHAEFNGQFEPVPRLVEPTAAEKVLFGNGAQLCGPGAALYVPARHRAHQTPF